MEKESFVVHHTGHKGKPVTPEVLEKWLAKARKIYETVSLECKKYPYFINKNPGSIKVDFDLPFPLTAKFVGKIGFMEIVEIKSGKRVGRFIRGNPLAVSTSTSPFYLCISIFPETEHQGGYLHPFTDRGLCWVYQSLTNACCNLILENWWEKTWKEGDIVRILNLARERSIDLIEKALNSQVKLPQPVKV
jgi:hypothetical protein